jgi:hypothetical protein
MNPTNDTAGQPAETAGPNISKFTALKRGRPRGTS